MTTDTRDPENMQERLWKEIAKGRYGMLGLVGEPPLQHFQPMTAFAEPESGQIWFFTRKDTDLAQAAAGGVMAMFVVQSKDQELQASISGHLEPQHDPVRIDRYWNPVVAAWYPDGKDDPRLTLLRFQANDAQIWVSEAGPVRFAYEIARANVTGKEPDLGERAHLDLDRGASA